MLIPGTTLVANDRHHPVSLPLREGTIPSQRNTLSLRPQSARTHVQMILNARIMKPTSPTLGERLSPCVLSKSEDRTTLKPKCVWG